MRRRGRRRRGKGKGSSPWLSVIYKHAAGGSAAAQLKGRLTTELMNLMTSCGDRMQAR